jgi:ABC-type transport system involved in cytochrome c biogenesis permease subunit
MNTPRYLLAALFVALAFTTNVSAESLPAAPEVLRTVAIQENGRKKPLSTVATETLQTISGRAGYKAEDGTRSDAMDALLSLWFQPEKWRNEPLILFGYRPLIEKLGLDPGKKRFSFEELSSATELRTIAGEAERKKARNKDIKLTREEEEAKRVLARLEKFLIVTTGDLFRVVPHPSEAEDPWTRPELASTYYPGETGGAIENAYRELRQAYMSGDPGALAKSADAFAKSLISTSSPTLPRQDLIELENHYYSLHPFRLAWVLYAIAAVSLMVTSVWGRKPGYRIGWAFALAGFCLQLYGFYCRIAISGRPPVTNMYESILWVAFGSVFFALVFEAIYRCRYFLLGATPLAVISLILADSQPTVLSSAINPLVPVLRDNFWLTTHVLSITLSYAAFLVAHGVAHVVLGKAILGRIPSAALYNYLYRAIQIGVLLLAIGTILGAVWANYSWGRFWDWDPKETWALIALLGYLAVLHGRIAGVWGGFGLAVGSFIGFLLVLMAWYGVNFVLGAGLHSYGFGSGGFPIALTFVVVELAFMTIGIICYQVLKRRNRIPAEETETQSGVEEATAPSGT